MIKEIVDIGRVSNKLGSVFTFKDLSDFYIEITLKWNEKDFIFILNETIQHTNDIEDYLEWKVHRGKKGSTLYFFPTSFIITKKELTTEKTKLIKKLQEGQKIVNAYLKDDKDKSIKDFLNKKSQCIINNIDSIVELANKCLDIANQNKKQNERKDENIAIIIKTTKDEKINTEVIFNIFQNIEFNNIASAYESGSGKKKEHLKGMCNLTQKQDLLYYPTGGFYYPFSTDKVNVKYNLKDDKNLFVLSKEAFIDFMIGTTFLESYNKFYFMGINSYITATILDSKVLKRFQQYIKKSNFKLDGFIDLTTEFFENENEILLNFYFFEPTKTGNNIIEYIKDILPSQLYENIGLFDELKEFYYNKFNRNLNKFSWQQHIYNIFYKDSYIKFRTALFRKIALNDINKTNNDTFEQILLFINERMQLGINKDESFKQRYYNGDVFKHFIFLHWISKIKKGETNMNSDEREKQFVGKTYEEKLNFFLNNGNLIKDSISMKIGVCVGLAIKILSWSINNYDKRTLTFVGKRIERNSINSLQIFVNEIFAKTKFHEYESLQSVNIKLATQEILKLAKNTFNKDEFVFGLFLGNELYQSVKSDKDPDDKDEEKIENSDKLNIGEENE